MQKLSESGVRDLRTGLGGAKRTRCGRGEGERKSWECRPEKVIDLRRAGRTVDNITRSERDREKKARPELIQNRKRGEAAGSRDEVANKR